jgi:hypothetical protein
MIVVTIPETTMLTAHLFVFLVLPTGAFFDAGCDTTYAVLRLPIEAVSPYNPYSSE